MAKANEKGQSTVEFALTLILLMTFVLFNFQFTLMSAYGNFVHYATFMAARAYLSSGPSNNDQRERAAAVLTRMLKKSEGSTADRWPSIAQAVGTDFNTEVRGGAIGEGPRFDRSDSSLSWMEGVRYTFRSRLFLIPMGGSSAEDNVNSLTLTSESWLGRDVSYGECIEDLDKRVKAVVIDNGC